MEKRRAWLIGAAAFGLACAGGGRAQVPADIQPALKALGRAIAPVDSARLYRPLHGDRVPADVAATKDIAFGEDAKQRLNVYSPSAKGAARAVLIYVPGGQGFKQMDGADGAPFYDNIGVWGVKHGLVVVTTQYRTGSGSNWDLGARDIAATIAWVKANAARHGGDPARVFIFGQSNGTAQLGVYLGRPELQGPGGPGVKGAILMSGAFNILPIALKSPRPTFILPPGVSGPPPGGPPPVDPAVLLQRSSLPALRASTLPLLFMSAEFDPEERLEMADVLTADLCRNGHACPTKVVVPVHGHISEVMSFNTADESVSGPVLKFIRGVR